MVIFLIIGGSASQKLAAKVAKELGDVLCPLETKKFPDGERYVRVKGELDKEVTIVQSTGFPQDENLVELLFLIQTLKDLGVEKVKVVVPYLGYGRQELRFKEGECISAQIVANLIENSGADEFISINLHEDSVRDFFNIPSANLSAMPPIAEYIAEVTEDPIIIAPDKGALGFAEEIAEILDCKCTYMTKVRLGPDKVETTIAEIENDDGSKVSIDAVNGKEAVIIDDIIAAGFGKGATYINPKTKKNVRRYVDFNQGLDAMFLNEAKAKRLGEIALRPARVAFDHIEDREIYERALRLCAKYGITELSNYVLYNSEDFGGKGHRYAADTPENLFERMKITLDIRDDINKDLPADKKVAAFSFPMRYIPLSAHERGYVGSQWNPKYLRAVQCMLIPTQGKGVGSRSFFEADFGKTPDEFVRYLSMPDKLIAARGNFSESSRGHKDDTQEAIDARKNAWQRNQSKLQEWNRLYDTLGEEKNSFTDLIGDNEYLPEKFFAIISDTQKKLYLHYLTVPRLISLLGKLKHGSPTYDLVKNYITVEFPDFYQDIVDTIESSEGQQLYMFANFLDFFGKSGVKRIIRDLYAIDYDADSLLRKWNTTCKKQGVSYVDFDLIRIYRRFVTVGVLSAEEHNNAKNAIASLNMIELASILDGKLSAFTDKILEQLSEEKGQEFLRKTVKAISKNIQLRLSGFLED